jgi:hypothetical protein
MAVITQLNMEFKCVRELQRHVVTTLLDGSESQRDH